ncbi:MAG TPA: CARDB domain-containing protein [Gemmataceae bacterium]|jgi:hypothetical protein
MAATRQAVWLLTLTTLAAAGCSGASPNSRSFSLDLPTWDGIRAAAKPPDLGPFNPLDSHAARLEVTPLESTGPTRADFLVVATVTDEDGQPRHGRRVEWAVEGVGNIVEVDESGILTGRGHKVDHQHAVSYTDAKDHTLKAADGRDVRILPGQTWCLVTSAVEGDTQITVHAPEIANWERHKVIATRHWCDAEWRFPPATACPAGGTPVLSTQLVRAADRQPLANYKVRYRILDGPSAELLPTRTAEAEVLSDAAGQAKVTMSELATRPGNTRVAVEVVRPEATGPGVVVGRGETAVQWQVPQIALAVSAPPTAAVGQDVPVTVTLSNPGSSPTQPVAVRLPVPQGMQYVASDPPAWTDGTQAVWQFPAVPGGGNLPLRATLRAPTSGVITVAAAALTRDGLRADGQATTRVAAPQLRVGVEGPKACSPGDALPLEVSVANTGTGPATAIKLRAEYDAALAHESQAKMLEVEVGTLEAGQSQTVPLTLTATRAGRPTVRVVAVADGSLRGESAHTIAVAQRALHLDLTGAPARYVNRPGTWDVHVTNAGEVPLTNVRVRVPLSRDLRFQSANGGGQFVAGDVVWAVGELPPGERRDLQLTATPLTAASQASLAGVATADKVPEQRAEAAFEVMGMAVLRAEVVPPTEAVAARGKAVITVRVTNQGTLAARQVAVVAVVPPPFLAPRFGTGPTVGRVRGERVEFAPAERIEPGQTVVFQVEVEGGQPGDGRVRVEVRWDAAPAPLVVEEAVRVAAAGR